MFNSVLYLTLILQATFLLYNYLYGYPLYTEHCSNDSFTKAFVLSLVLNLQSYMIIIAKELSHIRSNSAILNIIYKCIVYCAEVANHCLWFYASIDFTDAVVNYETCRNYVKHPEFFTLVLLLTYLEYMYFSANSIYQLYKFSKQFKPKFD